MISYLILLILFILVIISFTLTQFSIVGLKLYALENLEDFHKHSFQATSSRI